MVTLITGANGFVGRALRRKLAGLGIACRSATRDTKGESEADVVPVGDIGPATDWSFALAGADTVVHLAARVHVMRETATDPFATFRTVNVQGSVNLARQAAAAGARRLVFLSTIKVNGEQTHDAPFTASDRPNPQDAYAISKWEAEQALREVSAATGMEVVILRPPLIYGPGVGGNFRRLLDIVARGVPLPLGSVDNRRSLVYLDNLVDAIAACTRHPAAAGQTFLVSDREVFSTAQLIKRLGVALGRPAHLLPVPSGLLRLVAAGLGQQSTADRLLGSLVVDSSAIEAALGWEPPYSVSHGIADTAAWYRQLTLSPGQDKMWH